jgi:hypothetical protein
LRRRIPTLIPACRDGTETMIVLAVGTLKASGTRTGVTNNGERGGYTCAIVETGLEHIARVAGNIAVDTNCVICWADGRCK